MKRLIVLSLILIGCGTSKINKKEVDIKQEVSIKEQTKIEAKNDIKTKEIDTSFMWKREYIPMVASQPFIVNGKKYQNVRIEALKIKKGIRISKEDNSVLNQSKTSKKDIKTKVETKEQAKERYNNNFTIFYWIVIAILSYITFDYFKNK